MRPEMIFGRALAFLAFWCFLVENANAAMSQEQMEKMAASIRSTCVSKIGTDVAMVSAMRNGEFAEDRSLKCYIHCVMKTLRTFKNKRLDVEMMVKQIELTMPEERQPPLIASTRKCGEIEPVDDECQTAFNFLKCSYQDNPAGFFFP